MSENNLNEEIMVTVEDAPAITVNTPLVQNLTADNAAPTAKTVGDALAAKVDADDVMEHVTITFDGIESDQQGVLLVSAEDIPLTDSTTVNPQTGAGSIKSELDRIDAKTAADIAYGLNVSVKDKIDDLAGDLGDVQAAMRGDEIPIDGTTGAQSVKEAIDEVDGKTAADIVYADTTTVKAKVDAIEAALGTVQTAVASAVKTTAQTLTDAEKQQARTNIAAAGTAEAVLVNAQSLTTSQQAQARANIAAIGAADAVSVNAQTLTTSQQAQARANISAAAADAVSALSGILNGAFRIERYDYTVASVPASGAATITAAQFGIVDIPGYVPAGVVTYSTGTQSCVPYYLDAHTTTGNVLMIKNLTSTAITDREVFVAILWVKSDLMV